MNEQWTDASSKRNEALNRGFGAYIFLFRERALSALAVLLACYMVYATVYGPYRTTIVHMSLYLGASLVIYFLAEVKEKGRFGPAFDWFFALISAFATLYIVIEYQRISGLISARLMTPTDIAIGAALVISAVEAARRQSTVFAVLAVICILYTIFGQYAPGLLRHPGLSLERFIFLSGFGPEGIFGMGLSVAVNYLFMFMLMGAAFRTVGTTGFMLDFSTALFGRSMGGAGKTSLLASVGLGTVVASPTANVALTGSMTIPMMKESGYSPEQAAAIEVLNSEGAQMVPPILGIAAFIMVELTGISYATVVLASIVPATLYYLSAWIIIDLEARKRGLNQNKGSFSEAPKIFLGGLHLIFPIFALFFLIFYMDYTPAYAGMVCFGLSLVCAQIKSTSRFGPKRLYEIIDLGVREAVKITGFCVALGLIQQALTVTGLGVRMSEILLVFSGGYDFGMLCVALVAVIFLGLGLPTPLAYTLGAIFVAPPLVELGFPLLGVHMFIFFFAIKSGSTPPVAIVAVVGAAIAKANWWNTALLSFYYSIPGWLVAFAFVYEPALLFEFASVGEFLWPALVTTVGVGLLSVVLVGYFGGRLSTLERVVLTIASIALIVPEYMSSLAGLAVTALFLGMRLRRRAAVAADDGRNQ